MSPPPSEPRTRRTSYGRFLLVARILYLPGLLLVGLTALMGFAALLAGARHASEGAINQAFAMITGYAVAAIALPLLLFIPDRGPGRFVRWLHGAGALCLAIALGFSGTLMWKAMGEEAFKRWQIKNRLANLTMTQAGAEPIRVGETLIGVRLNVEFALANDVTLDQLGSPVARAMRSLKIQTTDATLHAFPFSHFPGLVTVTHNGQPARGEHLPAGRYQVSQTVWLAGLRVLEGDETPCKDSGESARTDRRNEVIAADKAQWIVTAAQKQGDLWSSMNHGPNSVLWQARSAPLDLRIDGRAWLASFDALPLPVCRVREEELKAARQRERIEAFYGNRLSSSEANQVLHSIFCADDIKPLHELVARGIPRQTIYRAAMRCAYEKRRPEILEILGPRLTAHPEDVTEHCSSLEGLHRTLDVERLRALTRAGLPINCKTARGDAWRNGLNTRTPGDTKPEEIARETEWIRLLAEQKIPVCERPQTGLTLLQRAVVSGSVESIAAWLDAGCDPAERADPATSTEPGWHNYSARLLWFLRRHQIRNPSVREWPRLSGDSGLNTRVTRRLGPPEAHELNTPFARRGGVVPLHDFVVHVLASPRMLRELVDLGARLDAASDSKARIIGINGVYSIEPTSWFVPGYTHGSLNADFWVALDVLTPQELRTLITPVNLTTGKPSTAMPQLTNFESPSSLGHYFCKRKMQTCPNPVR